MSAAIHVELPTHLCRLAGCESKVLLSVKKPVSLRATLDALESCYPMLAGTIREHGSKQRRPFIRFFACQEDISFDDPDADLPIAVIDGREPLLIVGAVAGG